MLSNSGLSLRTAAQYVQLLLAFTVNSPGFEFYVVTRPYYSRLFLCALVPAVSRVLASLPTSSYQPLSSVFPFSTAVLDASVPGWASVPPQMLKRIWSLGFIDMCELLPETWKVEPSSDSCCQSQRPRRGLVTDFVLWTRVLCYLGSHVGSVLSRKKFSLHGLPPYYYACTTQL